ncbi:hypothetical protein BO79DRAFT_69374 [Aspergillus costaricaensis CBS 115574]|uniref:Uncharacterized protein n=1 Tax=Aspergillus costaricaensis CBS 115574 TaxID=1448317 RepID=A0ACD1HYZ8_9EURO|nr:hypothetical protein BO79DRAFT_69374 [Aspergillus costaricaensis CBS 115574]RAK83298.1 hypothetical protein BO79DRAFT_69374 [Aspergillus costaricaensis CBS 115574]
MKIDCYGGLITRQWSIFTAKSNMKLCKLAFILIGCNSFNTSMFTCLSACYLHFKRRYRGSIFRWCSGNCRQVFSLGWIPVRRASGNSRYIV